MKNDREAPGYFSWMLGVALHGTIMVANGIVINILILLISLIALDTASHTAITKLAYG